MKICFLVGSLNISGGTYVIIQHASFLQKMGHAVTLAVQEPFDETTTTWHDLATGLAKINLHDAYGLGFDLVVATWWKTALCLAKFPESDRAYFVQSIESRFYSDEERPLKRYINKTYDLDVFYCTEAKWIQIYLDENHGKKAALVPNGIRKDLYFPNPRRRTGIKSPRVLVEGPFNVPFKNTGLAIALAKKAGAKEVWVLTGTDVKVLPKVDRVFSKIPISDVPQIYRECDILVKLSTVEGMFGPPLEMFHCGGTAIVLRVTGSEEYIVDNDNGLVITDHDTDNIIDKIKTLIDSPEKLDALKDSALRTSDEWPDWNESSTLFNKWVNQILSAPMDHSSTLSLLSEAEEVYIKAESNRIAQNKLIVLKQRVISKLAGSSGVLRSLIFHSIAFFEILRITKKVR